MKPDRCISVPDGAEMQQPSSIDDSETYAVKLIWKRTDPEASANKVILRASLANVLFRGVPALSVPGAAVAGLIDEWNSEPHFFLVGLTLFILTAALIYLERFTQQISIGAESVEIRSVLAKARALPFKNIRSAVMYDGGGLIWCHVYLRIVTSDGEKATFSSLLFSAKDLWHLQGEIMKRHAGVQVEGSVFPRLVRAYNGTVYLAMGILGCGVLAILVGLAMGRRL